RRRTAGSPRFAHTTLFRSDRGRLVPPVERLPLDQEERRVLDDRKGRTGVLVQELGVLVADHVVVCRIELPLDRPCRAGRSGGTRDRKSTRLNSSHVKISYA